MGVHAFNGEIFVQPVWDWFNLSDDTSYEIIYCAEAVKSGRLKFPAEKLDSFMAR